MKKVLSVIVCLLLALGVTACGNTANIINGDKLKIVTTVFPVYDWMRELTAGNENAEITMLLDNGVDLHNFQPTAEDIINIATCDMFIYIGGESDKWVSGVLAQKQNENMVIVNLFDAIGSNIKVEEIKEGMQADGEEAEDGEEEEIEYDEHIWLSLKNAGVICDALCARLCRADEKNADIYNANAQAYKQKLTELDESYAEVAESAKNKTLVFGDRFPFRYMTDDYGIDYYAAFAGCSAESEASFETCVFLAGKVDEKGLNCIMKIEGSDGRIAEQVKNNTKNKNADILTLNSMQSVTNEQINSGATYLKLAADNLEVLKSALNK